MKNDQYLKLIKCLDLNYTIDVINRLRCIATNDKASLVALFPEEQYKSNFKPEESFTMLDQISCGKMIVELSSCMGMGGYDPDQTDVIKQKMIADEPNNSTIDTDK